MRPHISYRSPDVFTVDRNISNTEALIWMAITEAHQIKFETTEQFMKIDRVESPTPDGRKKFLFKGKIPRTADLLYGIRFSFSVLDFTLKLIGNEGATNSTILDFTGTTHAVKQIAFDKPVPLISYFQLEMSYSANSREFPQMFDSTTIFTDYRVLHPVLTLGVLQDQDRGELHDSLLMKKFQPINEEEQTDPQPIEDIEKTKPKSIMTTTYLPLNIKPIVTLRDGSIYDKNLVTIQLQ